MDVEDNDAVEDDVDGLPPFPGTARLASDVVAYCCAWLESPALEGGRLANVFTVAWRGAGCESDEGCGRDDEEVVEN